MGAATAGRLCQAVWCVRRVLDRGKETVEKGARQSGQSGGRALSQPQSASRMQVLQKSA